MKSAPILIAGNDSTNRGDLPDIVMHAGYSVECTLNQTDTLEKVQLNGYGMVIIDRRISELSEMNLLREVKRISPKTPVVIFASQGTVHDAVEAMQLGAADYLIKPCPPDQIFKIVEKYLENGNNGNGKGSQKEVNPAINWSKSDTKIITKDKSLKNLLELAKRVAPSNSTVLIQGESGTGKELFAEYIHDHSGRNRRRMIALNCAALPESLAESELFGYEKGAFTGAFIRKVGKFEQANKSTLLLDEIGEMALPLQAKLLRAIQQKQIDRIGGTKTIPINTRIIAITNMNLKNAVSKGKFREDLFYRLNVIPLKIPKLSERIQDIPLLVEYFINKYCSQNNKKKKQINSETMEILLNKEWKGNVRELENCIERAVLLAEDEMILPEHLFIDDMEPPNQKIAGFKPGMTVKDMEKRLIFGTLSQVNQNRTKAADILGISIRTLRNKLNQYKEEV